MLWVDDGPKCSTRVAGGGGEDPDWDETLAVPLPPASRLDDAVLHVDVVHAADPSSDSADVVKPLVGSARLPLRDVLDEAGGLGGARVSRALALKRPSGRPQGRVEVQVRVRDRYGGGYDAYPAPGVPRGADPYYGQQGAPAYGYGQPPGYPAAAAPPYAYGAAPPPVGADPYAPAAQKSGSRMGVGTGVAVGAAAGLLGGLALAEGASYLEDKFEDDVAEKVEEDTFGGGDGDGDGDYYDDDY